MSSLALLLLGLLVLLLTVPQSVEAATATVTMDPYAVLGVRRSADDGDIKKQYKVCPVFRSNLRVLHASLPCSAWLLRAL